MRREALSTMGVQGITNFFPNKGFGVAKDHTELYRIWCVVDFLPKVQDQTAVSDELVDA
jgi:nitrogen regulatory protein PII